MRRIQHPDLAPLAASSTASTPSISVAGPKAQLDFSAGNDSTRATKVAVSLSDAAPLGQWIEVGVRLLDRIAGGGKLSFQEQVSLRSVRAIAQQITERIDQVLRANDGATEALTKKGRGAKDN